MVKVYHKRLCEAIAWANQIKAIEEVAADLACCYGGSTECAIAAIKEAMVLP